MTFTALSSTISTPYLHTYQLARLFPSESPKTLTVQLTRFVGRGLLIRLKRGIYLFPERSIDELTLASVLYHPSYVSLETALHVYGIVPDIPSTVTSITPTTSNTFITSRGTYTYSRIHTRLYFGYHIHTDATNQLPYNLAEPEKALLDWMYMRTIRHLHTFRVDFSSVNRKRLTLFSKEYPSWVQEGLHV